MTTTDHSNCLHPATSKGRAACRKAGSPKVYHFFLERDTRESAPCEQCFWNATPAAWQNLSEGGLLGGLPEYIIDAKVALAARSYLFDDCALSACTEHEHLL